MQIGERLTVVAFDLRDFFRRALVEQRGQLRAQVVAAALLEFAEKIRRPVGEIIFVGIVELDRGIGAVKPANALSKYDK